MAPIYANFSKFDEVNNYLKGFNILDGHNVTYYCHENNSLFDYILYSDKFSKDERRHCVNLIASSAKTIISNVRNENQNKNERVGNKKLKTAENEAMRNEVYIVCNALIIFLTQVYKEKYESLTADFRQDPDVEKLHKFPKKTEDIEAFVNRFRMLPLDVFLGPLAENFFKQTAYGPLKNRLYQFGFDCDIYPELLYYAFEKQDQEAVASCKIERMPSESIAVFIMKILNSELKTKSTTFVFPANLHSMYSHLNAIDSEKLFTLIHHTLYVTLEANDDDDAEATAAMLREPFVERFGTSVLNKHLHINMISDDMLKCMINLINTAYKKYYSDEKSAKSKYALILILQFVLKTVFSVNVKPDDIYELGPAKVTFTDEKLKIIMTIFSEGMELTDQFSVPIAKLIFSTISLALIRKASDGQYRGKFIMKMIKDTITTSKKSRNVCMYMFYCYIARHSNILEWDKSSDYIYVKKCMLDSVKFLKDNDSRSRMIDLIITSAHEAGQVTLNLRYGCENLFAQFHEVLIDERSLR